MEISKIKELCLSQAKYYYDYVKKYSEHNGKTIQSVEYIRFQKGNSPLLFELKLQSRIFDFEKTYYNGLQKLVDLRKARIMKLIFGK